jgi:hypothetical protein
MAHKIIDSKNINEWNRARALLIKYIGEEPGNTQAKRERFLAILNSRYGYTLEKAVNELEINHPLPTIAC